MAPTYRIHSYCTYCGGKWERPDLPWPRTCTHCANQSFLNPIPVAVVMIPIDRGLLAIRRGIPPQVGALALPGGYLEAGETWQEGAVREVREELGMALDPAELVMRAVHSAPRNLVLLFALARGRTRAELAGFTPTPEVTELVVLDAPTELAFPLHTRVTNEWFAARA